MKQAKDIAKDRRETKARGKAATNAMIELQRKATLAAKQDKAAILFQKHYRASQARALRKRLIKEREEKQRKAEEVIKKVFKKHILNRWLSAREEQDNAAKFI